MPIKKKMTPEPRTFKKTSQGTLFGSKSWYRGAKTNTKIPTSLSASANISADFFLSDKVTSVGEPKRYITGSLGCSHQLPIFQIVGTNQPQHRVTEKIGQIAAALTDSDYNLFRSFCLRADLLTNIATIEPFLG